jgi:hypothetical protein
MKGAGEVISSRLHLALSALTTPQRAPTEARRVVYGATEGQDEPRTAARLQSGGGGGGAGRLGSDAGSLTPNRCGAAEVGGPEKFRLDELIRRGLAARKDPREVVADQRARYYGIEVKERTLVPEDNAKLGKIRFEDWLAQGNLKQ